MQNTLLNGKKRLRIGFVFNHSFFLGGGEISFKELILHLDRKSFEPFIFVPAKGEIATYFKHKNYRVILSPFAPLKRFFAGTPVWSILMFIRLLKKSRINIIHANGSRACFYSILAGILLNIPVIWHVRETIKDHFFYDGFMGLCANKIICVSKGVQKKRFSTFPKRITKKIAVIYNGVTINSFKRDVDWRNKIRSQLKIDNDCILFGIVGNFIPLKGHDFFLQALAKAVELRPDLKMNALMIGRQSLDSRFYESLKQLVIELRLEERVLFMDYVFHIAEIYSALDILALPSMREGFSRSLLEAMSAGLPILASKIDEIEEAIRYPRNGLLVKFGDIEGMASAILTLSKDKKLRKTMGFNNQKRASLQFNIMNHVKSIEEMYRIL